MAEQTIPVRPVLETRRIQIDSGPPDYESMTLLDLKAGVRQRKTSWRGNHKKSYFIRLLEYSDDQDRKACHERKSRIAWNNQQDRQNRMFASLCIEHPTRKSLDCRSRADASSTNSPFLPLLAQCHNLQSFNIDRERLRFERWKELQRLSKADAGVIHRTESLIDDVDKE
jgi:hypothetical protein